MNPKCSANGRDTNQFIHELRLVPFQLSKLINDNDEMRERLLMSGTQNFIVFINVLEISRII
ncbi:hypothetical protein D3C74_448550 [compost metagenome]